MKFVTETGSQYEVNTDKKELRRLTGVKDPTTRLGSDGVWKRYISLFPNEGPTVGHQLMIVWDHNTPALDSENQDIATKTTITSKIMEVIP